MLVLTFQIGSERLALDVRRIREVVPRVRLQPVACSPPWLVGAFVYRGQVVTVVDLHRLVGAGECPPHLSTRIILVPQVIDGEERLLGLLAAQVADLREMQPPRQGQPRLAAAGQPGQPDLGPVLVDGREIVHFVDLDRLLPASYQSQLALVPRELPP
jgi:chemotaxis signal transduction protein